MANSENDWASSGDGSPGTERGGVTREPNTVPLLEEDLSVGTEEVETGRVRVRIATHEREQAVDVPLRGQHVEVEHVPIGREVDAIPPNRQEGDTTIVPVVEEVVVMSRKLVLKEEIHLRVVHSTEQHRENVFLRSQEAIVERVPPNQATDKR